MPYENLMDTNIGEFIFQFSTETMENSSKYKNNKQRNIGLTQLEYWNNTRNIGILE